MSTAEVVEDVLAHFGTKGMKWGVRKQYSTATSPHSSSVKGTEQFSKTQAAAMNTVAKKVERAYGFKIHEFVPLTEREQKRGYIAYVEAGNKSGTNVIHMTKDPKLKSTLTKLEKDGWFVPSSGKVIEANLTHESAHAMFHQRDYQGKGFIDRVKTDAPIDSMRKTAWVKAREQGLKDGDIKPRKGVRGLLTPQPEFQMAKKLSKYADNSLWAEEHEAEMFAAYHWSPNPPKFVDAFMGDIHKNMNKNVKPFSGRKVGK